MNTKSQISSLSWPNAREPIMARHMARQMTAQICQWARINTHSLNIKGLTRFSKVLETSFKPLSACLSRSAPVGYEVMNSDGTLSRQPLAPCLIWEKRPKAKFKVLLSIHMDTVFVPSVQFPVLNTPSIIKGPGTADAKGGIAVILCALKAFERQSPLNIGWTLIINSDEELGSPGSDPILRKLAREHMVGLVYEPSLPGGAFAAARKGSGNFTLKITGRRAHAGREPEKGRNAIAFLCQAIGTLTSLNGKRPGLTINTGIINGGSAFNVVPDLATAGFNIRVSRKQDQQWVLKQLEKLEANLNTNDGIKAQFHGSFSSPPKPFDKKTQNLFKIFSECGRCLNIPVITENTGGVCDGNRLADEGLPVIDTLGVEGSFIHSTDEQCNIKSLVPRAALTAMFLSKLENGEFKWKV